MGLAGVVSNIVIEGRRYPIPALLVASCVLLFSFFSAVSLIGRAHSLCLTTHAGGFSRTGAADHEAGKAAASTACEPAAAVFSGAWTLLPYYMDCIHSPSYKSENASGGCEVLALSGAGAGTEAWEQYKRTDALVIDPSRCEPFVDVIAPQCKARARLQPISVKLRPNTSDHRVLSQVYCQKHFKYMKKLADFMPIYKPVTFLDAGSNIGVASMLFSHAMMGNGEVLSVEAHPETFEAMVKNIVNFAGVVFPVQAAMVASKTAAQSDSLTFYGRTGEFWGFRVEHSDDSQDNVVTYEVPAKTLVQLRDMTASKHFDMIKLDIEGEEKYILEDDESKAVLCEAACIFMELHERLLEGCEAAFQAFMQGGCAGEQFEEIITTGEYILVCKPSKRIHGG